MFSNMGTEKNARNSDGIMMFNRLSSRGAAQNFILAMANWKNVVGDVGQRREKQLSETYWEKDARSRIKYGSIHRYVRTGLEYCRPHFKGGSDFFLRISGRIFF